MKTLESQGSEQPKSIKDRLKKAGLIMGLCVTSAFSVSMDFNSAKTMILQPTEEDTEFVFDGEFIVADLNAYGKKSALEKFAKIYDQEQVDIACLQEVHEKDIKSVKRLFPSSQVIFFGADRPTGLTKGYFGNAIISRTRLISQYSQRIDGWIDYDKLTTDPLNARKEDRVAGSADYAVDLGAVSLTNTRVIVTHVADKKRQLKDVRNFVKSSQTDSKLNIFCGDLNIDPDRLENADVLSFKDGWIVPRTGLTNKKEEIDYIGHKLPTDRLVQFPYYVGASTVLRSDLKTGSDHDVVMAKFSVKKGPLDR